MAVAVNAAEVAQRGAGQLQDPQGHRDPVPGLPAHGLGHGGQAVLEAGGADDDTPAQIKAWAEDIDREGVSLHVFAAEMLTESIAFGLCGILVEAPKPTLSAGKVARRRSRTPRASGPTSSG
jgi:hypothetical protein